MSLDAHARPPESLRTVFKKWQKARMQEINSSDEVLDVCHREIGTDSRVSPHASITSADDFQIFESFLEGQNLHHADDTSSSPVCYEVKALPGLIIYPSMLPRDVQIALLNKLLHRDLSNPSHKSNLHLHYEMPYLTEPAGSGVTQHDTSFFHVNLHEQLRPKDPQIHRPLTMKQMLSRKLRWVTLGGQYDWTAKTYPTETPPDFPQDIGRLLKGLFPNVDAQAAIVNFYTPGDTLSVHRDVSEECDRDLISISIGCDALFVVGNADGTKSATLRLRSGDIVLMSGSSRYAWHAIPRILPETCPEWLRDWPANSESTGFELWKGWMANKRVNLNVRQMRD